MCETITTVRYTTTFNSQTVSYLKYFRIILINPPQILFIIKDNVDLCELFICLLWMPGVSFRTCVHKIRYYDDVWKACALKLYYTENRVSVSHCTTRTHFIFLAKNKHFPEVYHDKMIETKSKITTAMCVRLSKRWNILEVNFNWTNAFTRWCLFLFINTIQK